jgi:hypothetical protein
MSEVREREARNPSEDRQRPTRWERKQQALVDMLPASKGCVVPADVWNRLSEREQIETMTGRSLDNCINILDLPMELAVQSPTVMTGKCQVIRAVLQAIVASGKGRQGSERSQQMLGELIGQFETAAAKKKQGI